MKYIRTTMGIYKEGIDRYIENNILYQIGYNQLGVIHLGEVIAQANTIEELCDGFHLDLGGEFDDTYLRKKDRIEVLKVLAFDYMRKGVEATLYAFIKTSKGLIYVAKMNDKGELELI